MSRQYRCLIFTSEMHTFVVSVNSTPLRRIKRSLLIASDQSNTNVFFCRTFGLHISKKINHFLFRNSACRYELFRDRTLRFVCSDHQLADDRHLLGDLSLLSAKQAGEYQFCYVHGTLNIGDETLYFAPAHSRALLFEHVKTAASLTLVSAYNGNTFTVLLMTLIDKTHVKLDIIDEKNIYTMTCRITKHGSEEKVYYSDQSIQIDLLLLKHKNRFPYSMYCANGYIKRVGCNDIWFNNQYFLSL